MIAIIIGTRAELIKSFPVMLELQKRKLPYYFIHTGQHNLKDLCRLFGVKNPDVVLSKEPEKSSRFNENALKGIFWNISLVFKIKKELSKIKDLKYVIYHGDTMTTATTAIASSKLLNPFKKYKNVHLEAGLRSGTIFEPMPEEISRKLCDRFSDILLAVSNLAENNLKKEKQKGKIILSGNTIIDSATICLKKAEQKKMRALSKEKFALITVHRHENIKSKERMKNIIQILSYLPIPSYFALHSNTLAKLKEMGLYEELIKNPNVKIIEPIDYISFIYQMKKCSLIVCDGGSMQEESLLFQKPCIILRKATERQEGLESNFQFLTKLDVEKTKAKIKEYLAEDFKVKPIKNPYGKPGLSSKIVDILKK